MGRRPAEVPQWPVGSVLCHDPLPQPGLQSRGRDGSLRWWSDFLNSASILLLPSLAFLCLLLSLPGVSGGGKAQVFAKLMTCLCAKLTGGWTWTQTLLIASRPLCWRPQSLAQAPCRLQPPPTPMLVALAPRSTPESPTMPSLTPGLSGAKSSPLLWMPTTPH